MNTKEAAQALSNACRFQHLSYQTEKAYLGWFWRFARFAATRPDADKETKVRGFLTHLAPENVRQGVAALDQIQCDQIVTEVGESLKIDRSSPSQKNPKIFA